MTDSKRRRRPLSTPALVLGGAALLTLLFLGAQAWAVGRLEHHLRIDAAASLRQTVDFRVAGIRAWAARQKDELRKVLEKPELIEQAATLVDLAKEPVGLKERVLASPAYKKASAIMAAVPSDLGGRGYIIISPSGVDLCAETEDIVGRVVTAGGAVYVRRINLGEWIVSRPYPDRQFAQGVPPDYKTPIMFVGGPMRRPDGQIIAMGFYRFSPDRFYEFLAPFDSEVFAFDEKHVLMNNLRDLDDLRKAGIVAPEADAGTAFRVPLRDPGADLSAGNTPRQKPENWAPTRLCVSAIQGKDGVDASGYPNLRGQRVLGAWSWLPEWDMGVGAELPLDRVIAPVAPVRLAFRALSCLPAAGALAYFVISGRSRRRSGSRRVFGSYRLERSIGRGGMAEVFLARHVTLERPAAVKILTAKYDDTTIARFEREARLASRLGHPNAVQIFDFGRDEAGTLYYAMEYVEGLNLGQLVSLNGPLPAGRAAWLLGQIAGSLEEAHSLDLLHRDLKPTNVMVCRRGGTGDLVKVLDFGIAVSLTDLTVDLTKTTDILGTPAFMAPERLRTPMVPDARSDIYSFGAVAFHLLTGRNVFEGSTPTELFYQIMTSPRPSPSKVRGEGLPEALERLVLDCLAIDPAQRPPNFRVVGERLREASADLGWGPKESLEWWTANKDRAGKFLTAVG